jgi:hypothetical protein
MKKLILIIVLTGMYVGAKAQNHILNPALDKFVGKWVYNENGQIVEVYLKKVVITLNNGTKIDEIEGHYKFTNKDKIVENTESRKRASLRNGTNHPFNVMLTDTDQIAFLITDSIKKKSGDLIITFKPGNPDRLAWLLRNSEGPKFHLQGAPPFDKNFTLPTHMLLTREKD